LCFCGVLFVQLVCGVFLRVCWDGRATTRNFLRACCGEHARLPPKTRTVDVDDVELRRAVVVRLFGAALGRRRWLAGRCCRRRFRGRRRSCLLLQFARRCAGRAQRHSDEQHRGQTAVTPARHYSQVIVSLSRTKQGAPVGGAARDRLGRSVVTPCVPKNGSGSGGVWRAPRMNRCRSDWNYSCML
jgi:hypothetical protein